MKKVTLITLFLMCLTFAVKAQDISKQLVGKWTLSDLKLVDKAGNDLKKMTKEQKKDVTETKAMLMDGTLVFDFMADGSMTSPMYAGGKNTWKIVGKQLEVTSEKEGKSTVEKSKVKIINGVFEMTTPPARLDGTLLVLMFKK